MTSHQAAFIRDADNRLNEPRNRIRDCARNPFRRRTGPHRRLLARRQLSVGRPDLPAGQPAAGRTAGRRARQTSAAGALGHHAGPQSLYAHLNRIIRNRDANVIYVTGPGHGGPGLVANAYLEGTYSEVYTGIEEDTEGLRKLFRQFSFPGGIPSHVAAQTPGSIHEGGELGYALVHAFGAAFDNPDLVVACVIGDGEAETGPLAASWHSNKFLNPAVDGAVLPILHLNGYKIANPTVLARIPEAELESLLRGYGYRPITVAGDEPAIVHQQLAAALDDAFDDIAAIQRAARSGEQTRAAGVADDRAAHPQGLDRAQGGRRPARRGHLAITSGAAGGDARQPRAPCAA